MSSRREWFHVSWLPQPRPHVNVGSFLGSIPRGSAPRQYTQSAPRLPKTSSEKLVPLGGAKTTCAPPGAMTAVPPVGMWNVAATATLPASAAPTATPMTNDSPLGVVFIAIPSVLVVTPSIDG